MKIKYNEVDKTLEINDGLKSHYFLVKTLMIIILINAIINLISIAKIGVGLLEVIWLILGIISIIVLYNMFLNITGIEKIPVDTISYLSERNRFGKNQYQLVLTNGKTRPLKEIKTENDLKEFQKLCSKIGLKL